LYVGEIRSRLSTGQLSGFFIIAHGSQDTFDGLLDVMWRAGVSKVTAKHHNGPQPDRMTAFAPFSRFVGLASEVA